MNIFFPYKKRRISICNNGVIYTKDYFTHIRLSSKKQDVIRDVELQKLREFASK